MWQIFKKDFKSFAASYMGLIVGMVFWVVAALFLWFIDGGYNILYSGLAELNPFFELTPWLWVFIIPAISMRSFSEEYRSGTIEILLTKPVGVLQVLFAKFLAVWSSVILILLPAAVYYFSISRLAMPGHLPDTGVVISGFSGLILLSAVFSMAGIMVSSMTSNQTTAYLSGVFLLFILYYGLFGLGDFNLFGKYDYLIQNSSLMSRYLHFVKGLIYFSDIIFFSGWLLIFAGLTLYFMHKNRR